MPTSPTSSVIGELRKAVLRREAADLSDGQLLDCFLSHGEEAAFEALVRRHGPMVLGVCRRVLRHSHDAEDAFQATFLVLMRKAASIHKRETLGAWLYGVAFRIAVRAKTMTARRRTRERQVALPARDEPDSGLWRDLEPLLDQEVSRLPAKYQEPLVLCDLQGRSRKDVAQCLGLREGTLSSRLARGRELLRKRLLRRGLTLGAGALAALLAQNASAAAVPPALLSATVKAAALFGTGQAAVAGALSAKAVALAQSAFKGMLLSKLKIAVALLLSVGMLGIGAQAYRPAAVGPSAEAVAAATLADVCLHDDLPADEISDTEEAADAPETEMAEGPPPITPPPAWLHCDPFYQKHVSARGLPIIGSAKVSDQALREAAYLVNRVLENRPDICAAMIESGWRFVVMAETERTTDLPEQRHLKPKESWDRLRGLGDRMRNCGEENLLGLPSDRWPGKIVLVHELAHSIHTHGLNRIDRDFERRLRQLYQKAMRQELWKGSWAARNYADYWAEAVQSYFDCNRTLPIADAPGRHVNTREELEAYDPEMFRFVDEVFRGTPWRYQPPALRN
jgi:RNA polymerase sigma factor (sigma-70 family)